MSLSIVSLCTKMPIQLFAIVCGDGPGSPSFLAKMLAAIQGMVFAVLSLDVLNRFPSRPEALNLL